MPRTLVAKIAAAADYFGLADLAAKCTLAKHGSIEDALDGIHESLNESNGHLDSLGAAVEHLDNISTHLAQTCEHVEGLVSEVGQLKEVFEGVISEGQYANEGNALRMVSRENSHD